MHACELYSVNSVGKELTALEKPRHFTKRRVNSFVAPILSLCRLFLVLAIGWNFSEMDGIVPMCVLKAVLNIALKQFVPVLGNVISGMFVEKKKSQLYQLHIVMRQNVDRSMRCDYLCSAQYIISILVLFQHQNINLSL